nr:unnamed protein product [Spirometra erinaceieuropaei]
MTESAHLTDGLFNVKSVCEVSFADLVKPTRLIFSRAFFIDSFKGVPREKVHENVKKEPCCDQDFRRNDPVVGTQRFTKTKSTAYYNSLTYALSLINNSSEEISSTDEDSEGKEVVRSNQPQDLESETDEEDLFRQMQALGLPTCFGRTIEKQQDLGERETLSLLTHVKTTVPPSPSTAWFYLESLATQSQGNAPYGRTALKISPVSVHGIQLDMPVDA